MIKLDYSHFQLPAFNRLGSNPLHAHYSLINLLIEGMISEAIEVIWIILCIAEKHW